MRFVGYQVIAFCLTLGLLSFSAQGEEDCRHYEVRNIDHDFSRLVDICSIDGKVSVVNKGIVESPKRHKEDKSQKNSRLGSMERPIAELKIDTETIQEAIKFYDSQKEPPTSYSPSEYELTKRDVESNQFLMMLAAWGSVLLLTCTIYLLNKNRRQLDTANGHAQTVADSGIDAAKAAVKAAKAAENAERAYVFLEFDTEFCGQAPDGASKEDQNIWHRSRIRITP